MNMHGILLLGHGTPSAEGTRAFLDFAQMVAEMADGTPVAAGFMEFASPTIAEGMAALQSRGAVRVTAVPVFLSCAGHTANDIPKDVEAAQANFPELQVRISSHVGSHPKVAELSALRFNESLADRAEIPAAETLAVIAAHGSPEPEAFEELERFAIARQKLTPVAQVVPCFSQMGAPLLKDVLPTVVKSGVRQIVVQPHFLLKGRLVDPIAATTAAVAAEHPEIEWIVAEPLGGHRLLAEAALELGMSEMEI
jgi:sirohydrochlorin ferrochelatase